MVNVLVQQIFDFVQSAAALRSAARRRSLMITGVGCLRFRRFASTIIKGKSQSMNGVQRR